MRGREALVVTELEASSLLAVTVLIAGITILPLVFGHLRSWSSLGGLTVEFFLDSFTVSCAHVPATRICSLFEERGKCASYKKKSASSKAAMR